MSFDKNCLLPKLGFYVKITLLQLGCPPHPDWSIFLTPDNFETFHRNIDRKTAGDEPAVFVLPKEHIIPGRQKNVLTIVFSPKWWRQILPSRRM